MKSKIPNSQRFKNLPAFKGLMWLTGVDDCIIYHNDKIIGKGSILSSTGKRFRCLWNSEGQRSFASILQARMGRFGVRGYRQDDYVYITSLYHPPSQSQQGMKLARLREIKAHEEDARQNLNQTFTGQQSSHNTYIPTALKNIQVKLAPKTQQPEEFEMSPIKTKRPRKEKSQISDTELENLKDKRAIELKGFKIARKFLKSTSLRLELLEAHFTVAEIEMAQNMIDIGCKYMSRRAYN